MAELEVRDGEASPDVATDQYAITISALNNRADAEVDAEVTIDLSSLPAGVSVAEHIASDGTYSNGTWDLGALKMAGQRRSVGKPEAATLTLILAGDDADSAEATATIANVANYTVCIGSDGDTLPPANQTDCESDAATTNVWYAAVCVNTADGEIDSTITVEATCDGTTDRAWTEDVCASSDGSVRPGRTEAECGGWFQGTVYDYDAGNDTATITAAQGTGGGGEGAPTLYKVDAVTGLSVKWNGAEYVYGLPVVGYQVWRLENPWMMLDDDVTVTEYLDTTVDPGETRYYRVRAVNEAGVPGPWSEPMQGVVIDPGAPGVSVSEKELTIAEGETADYTVTLGARPLSNVTVRVDGGGVVSPNPSRLIFTPSNYNMPQTVELTANQDNNPDNEEIEVAHSTSSSDGAYNRLTVAPVAVTVIDDDSGVSVSTDQESVNEGETITFTLTRTGNTDGAITVDLFVDQRGSFLPADQLGARSEIMGAGVATATVTVQTDNDTVLENNGSVTLEVERGTGYLVLAPSFATVDVADDDGPPGQPVSLAAEDLDERVRLTWSAAPSPSSAIENYSYRVRDTNGGSWDPDWTVIQFSGIGTTEHTVTGLTNGTDYTIQVRARNASGDGAAAEVTANPKAEPDRPDVTVSSRSEALLVTWTVPNDGGRDVTQYQVQWKSGSEAFDSSRQAAPTTPEHTIPSLTNGTEYGVRVRAMNEVGWGDWSFEQRGTPTPRPPTSLRITTDAEDGVSEPFRVTFTFTDEDHDGTQYVVEGFGVDDVEARYGAPSHYEVTLADFRVEKAGLVYSALVDEILDGRLRIDVPAGAAQSTHDGQQSTSAALRIDVEAPEAVVPTGTEIWSADMTVGDYDGNAVGYIDPDRSQWSLNDTIGSLAGDDGNEFTYAGTNYTVGELSYVSAWNMVMFILCPGLEAADATFDLYLDDTVDGRRDHTLNFDPDEVESREFNNGSCVEYRWSPRRVAWQEDGNVNVRLVR